LRECAGTRPSNGFFMNTIVIYTAGTLGDHLPFFALGQALKQRGQRVLLAVNRSMQSYAEKSGLETAPLTNLEGGQEEAQQGAAAWNFWKPAVERSNDSEPSEAISEAFLHQCRDLALLCQQADLLVASTIRPQGYIAAQAVGLPWVSVSMNPSVFFQSPDPQERRKFWATRREEHQTFLGVIQQVFQQLGVSRPLPPFTMGWGWAPRLLLASSPHFIQPNLNQLQPQCQMLMTGFWYYQDPAWQDWQPDEALRRFCEPDDPQRRPLVLAYSSQPLEQPAQILALHARAAAILNRPLLVQRGWAGFSEADLPPEIDRSQVHFADFLPHDWLFARAACAIQHGGIGSIARALRQGCPLVVEPFGNDQLFNAVRVSELGAGVAMHPFRTTPEGLAQVLRQQVLTPECRQKAETLGEKLRLETGLETACQLLENDLAGHEHNSRVWQRPPLFEPKSSLPESLTFPASTENNIPRIIHQTWKDTNIPPEMRVYQETWQTHHPDWTFYLWTDVDNREFIRQNYAWFLPVYDNYPEPIMRADAVRYFILHHFGGVYVDLDFECLRPLDSLLDGKQLVFGVEPEAHLALHLSRERGMLQIVCNAFMACIPGHPFWEHLFKQLVAYHLFPGPLDATGPFLLTRSVESYTDASVFSIQPAELLYPVSNQKPWSELTSEEQAHIHQTAFAIHHWFGNWWRKDTRSEVQPIKATQSVKGQPVSIFWMPVDRYLAIQNLESTLPRVSCLMVTHDRPHLAQRAVRCFQKQTYSNKELLVLDDGEDKSLESWCAELKDERIRFLRLPPEQKTLGELRNLAVKQAGGAYIAQWDDDDLSDPQRLLERHQLWWPQQQRLAISTSRMWESSFICRKDCLPPYPPERQGEDTPVIEQIVAQNRTVILDFPQLYTYVFHGANTFNAPHWEAHWRSATQSFEGDAYAIQLAELSQRLGPDLLPLTDAVTVSPEKAVSQTPAPPATQVGQASVDAKAPAEQAEAEPTVLILTPVKDAADFLPRFFENLHSLSYPHERLSLAFLEGDSRDDTYARIERALPSLRKEYARVELYQRDYGFILEGARWEAGQQFKRRSIQARSRNYLLSQALQDEAWVLWIDVDVARWPADIIEQLLAARKEIVVPNCLGLGTQAPFDMNTFKLQPGAEKLDWRPYIVDGILQPPPGFGRWYLNDLSLFDAVELDGVGASMLLVYADLHREGLVFPTFSYKLHIETEGLAQMARDMGYRCWGLPKVVIYHPTGLVTR
jgi:mannosyltransferase OCH1-like enzyme/UDP:flavonoid glycosyltransferase YjiC (YdhE family)